MTRKELLEVKESYRALARECASSDSPYTMITGICGGIAQEECYNHHERGQRLWAFFQTLNEEAHNGQ